MQEPRSAHHGGPALGRRRNRAGGGAPPVAGTVVTAGDPKIPRAAAAPPSSESGSSRPAPRVEPGESPGGSLRPTAARIMGPPKLPMGADGAARIPVPVGEPSEKGACNLQGDRPRMSQWRAIGEKATSSVGALAFDEVRF